MLQISNIHKVYRVGSKDIHVLKGVDLSIDSGKFIAIVGPSGAGKSTLLHVLGGLDNPSQGKVVFQGEDIYKLSDTALSGKRNKSIGFVFQFYHLLPEFNVLENVMMPAMIGCVLPAGRQGLREKAIALLEKVGLKERITHFPSQLSGGEQQRVAIVRALINEPALLLCDEPTGNLDSESGKGIVALLKKINSENKMAVVLVTHNVELANSADRIFHLRDGVLVS